MADTLVFDKVLLPKWNDLKIGKVLCQAIDENEKWIGIHNNNPLLNTLVYDVELPDSDVKRYVANIISENILSQCDPDGF